MAIHDDVIVSSQGAGISQKGGIVFKILSMTVFYLLMIILVKYEDQQGRILTMVVIRDKQVLRQNDFFLNIFCCLFTACTHLYISCWQVLELAFVSHC